MLQWEPRRLGKTRGERSQWDLSYSTPSLSQLWYLNQPLILPPGRSGPAPCREVLTSLSPYPRGGPDPGGPHQSLPTSTVSLLPLGSKVQVLVFPPLTECFLPKVTIRGGMGTVFGRVPQVPCRVGVFSPGSPRPPQTLLVSLSPLSSAPYRGWQVTVCMAKGSARTLGSAGSLGLPWDVSSLP